MDVSEWSHRKHGQPPLICRAVVSVRLHNDVRHVSATFHSRLALGWGRSEICSNEWIRPFSNIMLEYTRQFLNCRSEKYCWAMIEPTCRVRRATLHFRWGSFLMFDNSLQCIIIWPNNRLSHYFVSIETSWCCCFLSCCCCNACPRHWCAVSFEWK